MTALSAITAAPTADLKAAAQSAGIKTAAKDFEGVFLSEMLSHMFDEMTPDPMFGGGHGEKMFHSMLVNEYGKMIAANGKGIGVSDQIQNTMIQMQQRMNGG